MKDFAGNFSDGIGTIIKAMSQTPQSIQISTLPRHYFTEIILTFNGPIHVKMFVCL